MESVKTHLEGVYFALCETVSHKRCQKCLVASSILKSPALENTRSRLYRLTQEWWPTSVPRHASCVHPPNISRSRPSVEGRLLPQSALSFFLPQACWEMMQRCPTAPPCGFWEHRPTTRRNVWSLKEATGCARTQCSDDSLTIVQLNDSNRLHRSYCVYSEGLYLAFHRTHILSCCIFTWPPCQAACLF